MTQVTALLLVGLCLASPILAYDQYEPDQEYDALYGYDDMLSQRDIEIANDHGSGDAFDGGFDYSSGYQIEDMAVPGYDDFYDGGIGLSYYDGYFEDEAPADCTEGDDGHYIVDGPVCDVNVTGADALLAKAGVEKGALDGTYKVVGCKNGLPRYALDCKAEAMELWFSTMYEAWVFGGSSSDEEAQDGPLSPLLLSLDVTTRPNFVRPSDWAHDFQAATDSDVKITCANSMVLEDTTADEFVEYDGAFNVASDLPLEAFQEGEFWDDSTADAEFDGGEYYGAGFDVGDDETYSQMEEPAVLVEPEAGERPSDFQSAYEASQQEASRDTIKEVPGRINRKLSAA